MWTGINGLRQIKDQIIASAGLFQHLSEAVPPGQAWRVTMIAWEISSATSGGNTRCRLYVDRQGTRHYLDEQLVPAANWLYTHDAVHRLYPGERVGLELDQAQASCRAQLWVTGDIEPLED